MGVIRPVKGKNAPQISRDVIMVSPKRELNYLAERLGAGDYGEIDGCLYRLYLAHDNVAICGPFLGAPQAVMALEKLIALGAERIWVFSWCGSIAPDIKIGDVVICKGSFSEEGTSQHYPIPSEPIPDPKMTQMIKGSLSSKGIRFFEGPLWTTDAPYRETPDKIAMYRQKGAIGVDMEISALMTVAIFRAVSLAGIFVVSDELNPKRWRPGFSSPILKESSKKVLDLLMELALNASA